MTTTTEKERHQFLLNIDKELWERFLKTIPPYYNTTEALTKMIQDRVNDLEKEWNAEAIKK